MLPVAPLIALALRFDLIAEPRCRSTLQLRGQISRERARFYHPILNSRRTLRRGYTRETQRHERPHRSISIM
jgi:hypothetical protein